MNGRSTAVVVGGGVSGMLAAHLLRERHSDVYIVEGGSELGGLLRSTTNTDGDQFDIGTHIPQLTQNNELNDILFGKLDPQVWQQLPRINAGSYFAGKLSEHSAFPNINGLTDSLRSKAFTELRERTELEHNGENLAEHTAQLFGPTIASQLHHPAAKKLFGVVADQLAANALMLFGLGRVLAFTPEETRRLKHQPIFDQILGFHKRNDAQPGRSFIYPRKFGIGRWVAEFTERLLDRGVNLLTQNQIGKIEFDGDRVASVELEPFGQLKLDEIVWSAPPGLFLKTIGVQLPGTAPSFRNVSISNYVFDRPFLTDVQYLQCFDSDMKTFRVTLYPNLRSEENHSRWGCSVEHLCSKGEEIGEQEAKVTFPRELQQMGVLAGDAKVLFAETNNIWPGFPVLTPEFVQAGSDQTKFITQNYSNVLCVGRAAGKSFFMNDVLEDTYQRLIG